MCVVSWAPKLRLAAAASHAIAQLLDGLDVFLAGMRSFLSHLKAAYTFTLFPDNWPFYHTTWVEALAECARL